MRATPPSQRETELAAALAQRDAVIASLRATIEALRAQMATLESTLVNHAHENEILKRRLFGPKSERSGTSELQLLLGDLLTQEAALTKQLEGLVAESGGDEGAPPSPPPADKPEADRAKPKGRRDLSKSSLPREVIDFRDLDIEEAGGKFIGWDESFQLMHVRGGARVLCKRTAKYAVVVGGEKKVLGTEMPPVLFPRTLLHTSALAWIAVSKFAMGIPHARLERSLVGLDERIDRGTMCRNMEELGNTLGATVVAAMMRDAIENCAVLSTDATGAAIQPEAGPKGQKQVCKKGHFFTVVADADHVLYAYTERHTQDAVAKLFHGFGGFLQSDASSVYDILERGPPREDEAEVRPTLVGCWAHARRYFFEAAICKYAVGVEGLTRIRAIYAADEPLADLPPSERRRRRLEVLLPLIDDFFRWVAETKATAKGRTLATKALGYATNQEAELRRVLDDGRLPLDNTRSERALRSIVVGRKNWLFYGSDVHADAAAALFSVIASCRLHGVEPEQYLDEIMKVLPFWPKERHLELAPKYWKATRARLDDKSLRDPLGIVEVPPPLGIAGG